MTRANSSILKAIIIVVALAMPWRADAVAPLAGEGDGRGIPTVAPLLEKVTPAVVNISVVSERPMESNPLYQDPFFRRFFDLPELPRSRPQMSAGSGVIVDAAKGYVLTNHHVVDKGDQIVVTLKDRRRFDAELVGSDAETDIALLKIEPEALTDVPLGDSDRLKVGDFVVAVGNPFGLGQTVTSGIVSALGRGGLNVEGYEDFIQTDAPINPGNSGGALLTLDGRLVGINTAIIAPAGGNVGIGFAVPVNMARAVMEQLIEYGEVRRGRLGVMIQDLTPDLAEALRLPRTAGAVIASVEEDTPAERAGLRPGDIVVAVNGRAVENSADLRNTVGLTRAGSEVELTLLRDGREVSVTARLGPGDRVSAAPSGRIGRALAGAEFEELKPGMNGYGVVDGVAVSQVAPGSPAARVGLRPGDVIMAVNREPVKSVEDLSRAIDKAGPVIALNLYRNGAELFVVVR
ncbi:DegQ family serine endoprotease [Oceanibaculum pacificum]|uniref:Serine endoprotease DegQ n=1 Tax=Oceanibaculum pacificum TaxID=580166 RepID=A0A154W1H9_9PROT|nr:DegQ family serine endoprotease [Oceanibaculum pacificum]KZD07339.1 serine endoprotease DegQ [Oceanibaculum pacificum]